jgi:endonuclease G
MAGQRTLSAEDWAFLKELKEFIRSKGEAWLNDPNITSVGIGMKEKDGSQHLAIQFTVRKKARGARNTAELEAELAEMGTALIPESATVGGREILTDIVERSYEPAYVLVAETEIAKDVRKTRQRVLAPGMSVGHPATSAGTLGAIVYDARTGTPCVLSNWHVLHTASGKLGDPMLQPGPHDDDRVAQNHAGTLLRSHLGMAGDCAISRIEDREFDAAVLDLNVCVARLARPELGDRVVKSGRTTGVTSGIVRRIETVAKLAYEGMGEQLIGGFEIGLDEGNRPPGDEISKGGDSGSAWLVLGDDGKPTDIMVGLHFAGEGASDPDEHALACYAHAVFEKLEIAPTEPPAILFGVEAPEFVGTGFDEDFLRAGVAFPELARPLWEDAVKLNRSHLIPYTHFSVCLSESRRLPRVVAWNIDGARLRKAPRKGFKFDPRIDEADQAGNEVYEKNKLDRGHIARRADLVWGTKAEAEQANSDSFYYTNIAPQHQAFNQSRRHGLWGELEDAIFDQVDVQDLHVSVMGGPILKDDDPPYEGVQLPRSFWKLIAYVDAEDGKLKAQAFVLSQNDLLNDIEALDLDEFRIWGVTVADLQTNTGLRFVGLVEADAFVPEVVPEVAARRAVREIRSFDEVVRKAP